MSRPTEYSWQALKRVCRFLRSAPRLLYNYNDQATEGVDVYTDADWAGCPKIRKSISGDSVMFGSHLIKHWSSTQTSVALSSGEAEFAGVIRGAGQGLGYQAVLRDLGVTGENWAGIPQLLQDEMRSGGVAAAAEEPAGGRPQRGLTGGRPNRDGHRRRRRGARGRAA